MVGIGVIKYLISKIKYVVSLSLISFKSLVMMLHKLIIKTSKYFLSSIFRLAKYIIKKIKNTSLYTKNSIKKIIYSIYIFIFPNKETRNSKGIFELCVGCSLIYFTYKFSSSENYFDIVKNSLSLLSIFTTMMVVLFITKRK